MGELTMTLHPLTLVALFIAAGFIRLVWRSL